MADILLSLGVDTTQVRAQLETVAAQVQQAGKVSMAPQVITQPYQQLREETTKLGTKVQKVAEIMSSQLVPSTKMAASETTAFYQGIKQVNTALVTEGGKFEEVSVPVQNFSGLISKAKDVHENLFQSFQKALPRMLMWGLGWMTIYGTFRKIIGVVSDNVRSFLDLEHAMARVNTVTRVTGDSQKQVMSFLRQQVLDYTRSSTAELLDVAKALYYLGTAGLTVSQEMAGMKPIMDLTIGTLGNVEQIGKLVAGSFNMFSKSLKGATTDSEKFKKITDILAYTYITQQVELDEIASAFNYVGSAAGLLDVNFETLVGTIGFLNTGMLKGSKSGTSLMNAFIQIADKSDILAEKFGIALDPTKPLNFIEVMDQLNEKIGGASLSTENLRQLMEVFGNRGGRAVASIISRFDEWKKAIGIGKETFANYTEYIKLKMEDTLPGAFKKLGNALQVEFIDRLEPTLRAVKDIIVWMNKTIGAGTKQNKAQALAAQLMGEQAEKSQHIAEDFLYVEKIFGGIGDKIKYSQGISGDLVAHYDDLVALGIPEIMAQIAVGAKETEDYVKYLPAGFRATSAQAESFYKILARSVEQGKSQEEIVKTLTFAYQTISGIDTSKITKFQEAWNSVAKRALDTGKESSQASKDLLLADQRRMEILRQESKFQSLTNAGVYDYQVTREKINFQIKDSVRGISDQAKKEDAITKLSSLQSDNLEQILLQTKQYGISSKNVEDIYKLIADYHEQILERNREIVKIFSTQLEESLYNVIKGTGTWSDMIQNISDELLKLQLKRLVHKLTIDLFEQPTDKFGIATQNFWSGVKEFGQHVYNFLTGQAPAGQIAAPIPGVPVAEKATISKEELLRNFGLAGTLGIGAAIAQTQKTVTQPKQIFTSKEDLIKSFGLSGVMGAVAAISKTQVEEKEKLGFDFTEKEKIDTTAMLVDRLGNYKNKLDEVNGSIERLESGEAQAFGISKQEWLSRLTEKANDYKSTLGLIEDQLTRINAVKPSDQVLAPSKEAAGSAAAATALSGFKQIMTDIFPQAKNAQGKPTTGGKILGGVGGAMQVYQATQAEGGAQGAMAGAMGGGQLGMALGGPTGAGIGLVVGGLLGYFMGEKNKKKKQEESVEHQTLQIASRIDITNSQLQIANRNLSAMKRAFEGYVMPTSQYFSESPGIERRFQLSSMRGYY